MRLLLTAFSRQERLRRWWRHEVALIIVWQLLQVVTKAQTCCFTSSILGGRRVRAMCGRPEALSTKYRYPLSGWDWKCEWKVPLEALIRNRARMDDTVSPGKHCQAS